MCQAYIKLKLLTGFRQTDLLQLTISELKEDGIHVKPSKTEKSSGRRSVREWDDWIDDQGNLQLGMLRQVVQEVIDCRPVDISPYLFCNRDGEPYIKENGNTNGWDSIWQRFMKRVVAETKAEHFQERDLRAKAATDADSLEHARGLLDHTSTSTTRRIYRRKAEAVKRGKASWDND